MYEEIDFECKFHGEVRAKKWLGPLPTPPICPVCEREALEKSLQQETKTQQEEAQLVVAGYCEKHPGSTGLVLCGEWCCATCADEKFKAFEADGKRHAASSAAFEESQRAEKAREELQRRIRDCQVPDTFQGKTFDNFDIMRGASLNILRVCQKYAVGFKKGAGKNLIMFGNVGNGKTHLACAIATHVINHHGCTAVFANVMKLTRLVRDSYSKKDVTESDILDKFMLPDLLILDDVGVQSGSNHEFTTLHGVLTERYERGRSTIITTNLQWQELSNALGERGVSRLIENGTLLEFSWQDHRYLLSAENAIEDPVHIH